MFLPCSVSVELLPTGIRRLNRGDDLSPYRISEEATISFNCVPGFPAVFEIRNRDAECARQELPI